MESDGNNSDSSSLSLSVTQSDCHSDVFECVLDMGSIYHICPRKKLFASFEELDGGLVSIRDDHTCWLVDKGIVRIKMYDGQ